MLTIAYSRYRKNRADRERSEQADTCAARKRKTEIVRELRVAATGARDEARSAHDSPESGRPVRIT
jgi:hypothetical protein